MDSRKKTGGLRRRGFLRGLAAAVSVPYLDRFPGLRSSAVLNDVFWVKGIPDHPFYDPGQPNFHVGLDSLLHLMADNGLMFYRSSGGHPLAGPTGLIAPSDVVLLKVNAQWKYRGCTNSDLIRGLIQRILDHPDGFDGEVFIDGNDHARDGYRKFESVSYPCFTTAGGNRVELKEGIWKSGAHHGNLKLINVPVLKHHDTGGSEITASLKHFYGLVSMSDGQVGPRHYGKLGKTCGTMMGSVAPPVLTIIDAIWVSHSSLKGYPADTEKGILVGRVTKSEAEMWVRDCFAGDFLNNVRLAVSRSELHFIAPALGSQTPERHLQVAVSGGRALIWRGEMDVPWLSCVPSSGSGNKTVIVLAHPAGLGPGKHTGRITIHCPGAINSPQPVSVVLNISERPRKAARGSGPAA